MSSRGRIQASRLAAPFAIGAVAAIGRKLPESSRFPAIPGSVFPNESKALTPNQPAEN
jgi:hypothetical protein